MPTRRRTKATPEKPAKTYEPRTVPAGTSIGYTARDGSQRRLVANDQGQITPESAEDAAVIDGFAFASDEPADGKEG